jgi:hypothetical protein
MINALLYMHTFTYWELVCFCLCSFVRCICKLVKSFIVTGWLLVYMEQLSSHWMDFLEILYLRTFRISATKNSSFIKI